MADSGTKKKKVKVPDAADGKKSSKKKDGDNSTSKRSSSPKKDRRSSPSKERRAAAEEDHRPHHQISDGNADFEAGIIFNRYDKEKRGVLTAEEFRLLWREGKPGDSSSSRASIIGASPKSADQPTVRSPVNAAPFTSFEAGQIFSKFDADGDGRINKSDFENILRDHPEVLKPNYHMASSYVPEVPKEYLLPTEVITGRLLTHYDETAGVALPQSAVEQHQRLGNTVLPLPESYRFRYDKLRSLLTGKLFPRREHLLQLRRQLQNCSAEVEASKKGIERETISDSEQILERLRSVEAMRQSSIKHQVLQLETELESIERIVRRIELANSDNIYHPSTGVLITSAAPGSVPTESVRGPRAASMIELIQQFGDLSASMEKLSTKTMTVQTDFPTDDFPRETAERLEILARCDQYVHAVSVKDHMLWTVLKEKEKQEELLEGERRLSHEYAQEVAHWAEVAQTLANQVKVLQQEKKMLEITNDDLIQTLRENNVLYVSSL